jgi:hypothetical protein
MRPIPSSFAISAGPLPDTFRAITASASTEGLRPLYTPAALALAMPSSKTVFDDMPGNKLGVMAIPAALEGAGGQGGIRTHGELPPTTVFKFAAPHVSARLCMWS